MVQRDKTKIFLSTKMGNIGTQYHSYRCAITEWIESEYPFLHVQKFESSANAEHFRKWEIRYIRESAFLIGIIFTDSEEVIFEIETAINFKNPVFLFFFPSKSRAGKTWTKFAKIKGIKAVQANDWEKLILSVRNSIDGCVIDLLNQKKGRIDYTPPEPTESI